MNRACLLPLLHVLFLLISLPASTAWEPSARVRRRLAEMGWEGDAASFHPPPTSIPAPASSTAAERKRILHSRRSALLKKERDHLKEHEAHLRVVMGESKQKAEKAAAEMAKEEEADHDDDSTDIVREREAADKAAARITAKDAAKAAVWLAKDAAKAAVWHELSHSQASSAGVAVAAAPPPPPPPVVVTGAAHAAGGAAGGPSVESPLLACRVGFHQELDSCQVNVCSCPNGVAVTGDACITHAATTCRGCAPGYQRSFDASCILSSKAISAADDAALHGQWTRATVVGRHLGPLAKAMSAPIPKPAPVVTVAKEAGLTGAERGREKERKREKERERERERARAARGDRETERQRDREAEIEKSMRGLCARACML